MLVKNVIKTATHKSKYNFKQVGLTGAVRVLEAAAFSLRKDLGSIFSPRRGWPRVLGSQGPPRQASSPDATSPA